MFSVLPAHSQMLEKYGYWTSSATSYIVNKVLLEPNYTGSLIQSWLPYGTRPELSSHKRDCSKTPEYLPSRPKGRFYLAFSTCWALNHGLQSGAWSE